MELHDQATPAVIVAVIVRSLLSVREVRKALGISHGEAGRLRLKAVAEGILESEPEDQAEEPEAAADGPFRLN
jgi:hypothetical protein